MIVAAILTRVWLAQTFLVTPLVGQDRAESALDTTFLLSTDDPTRVPSPFVGNGHLGVVIPPLGMGSSSAFMAGLYEEAEGDIPRIVIIPASNILSVNDATGWLAADGPMPGAIDGYQQLINMRTGVARTVYRWVNGSNRTL